MRFLSCLIFFSISFLYATAQEKTPGNAIEWLNVIKAKDLAVENPYTLEYGEMKDILFLDNEIRGQFTPCSIIIGRWKDIKIIRPSKVYEDGVEIIFNFEYGGEDAYMNLSFPPSEQRKTLTARLMKNLQLIAKAKGAKLETGKK
jgi:hypothetical protein